MKNFRSIISVVFLLLVIFWSFSDLSPKVKNKSESNDLKTEFSIDNALIHLKEISREPHYTGSNNHLIVQKYLLKELTKIGLNPKVELQVAINKWRSSTNTSNIVATIKGSENGKSLVLLSHYDSRHHSSLGASDAGTGVVTILEGTRAFLAKNKIPKNDVHIVLTDAEEIGLLGAKAFVENSPLANNVGLVINYEARGSGGPSYMLMETNGKNSKILKEFIKSSPTYPAANSLMYSIYKMLPNDTDLTIFREDKNINGLNFAFIGDHFDYHTEQDSFERVDLETLIHQADYFMTTLNYFANSDLSNLDSDVDRVFTNFPFLTLLHFPFSWIFPLLFISILIFLLLIYFGIKLGKISFRSIIKGGIPFICSLLLCIFLSFGLWKLLLIIYPNYNDISHGFTYNGYEYISAFSFLNIWIFFKIYHSFFDKYSSINLIISPVFFWLIINCFIFIYLKGAAYFIIPVIFALLTLLILIFIENKNIFKFIFVLILSTPLIYIFSPHIRMFPVGLGLNNLFISSFFIVLILGLLIPVFASISHRKILVRVFGFCSLIFFVLASIESGYDQDKKKPNSIVYIKDFDKNISHWASYDNVRDDFTNQFFKNSLDSEIIKEKASQSKYNNTYKHFEKTENRDVKKSTITIVKDSVEKDYRYVTLILKPNRPINKINFTTESLASFEKIGIQDVFINNNQNKLKSINRLFTYYFTNYDKQLKVDFIFKNGTKLNLKVTETSYDLLSNSLFEIKPRPDYMMAKPFVTNDAIITIQKINI